MKLGTVWAVMDAGDVSGIEDIVSECRGGADLRNLIIGTAEVPQWAERLDGLALHDNEESARADAEDRLRLRDIRLRLEGEKRKAMEDQRLDLVHAIAGMVERGDDDLAAGILDNLVDGAAGVKARDNSMDRPGLYPLAYDIGKAMAAKT